NVTGVQTCALPILKKVSMLKCLNISEISSNRSTGRHIQYIKALQNCALSQEGRIKRMKFTELTEEEYQKYIEKGEESAFFQMIENKANREMDGQEVRLLGVKDSDGKVVAACLFTLK